VAIGVQSTPAASLIIATADRWGDLLACLTAVLENTRDVPHEVIVVDDGSRDATRIGLPRLEGIRHVRNDEPVGVALARNQGASLALADVLVFLDNRARPSAGWLAALLAPIGRSPSVHVTAPRLVGPGGTPREPAIAIDGPIANAALPGAQAMLTVAPEAVAVRSAAFRTAGGFDGGFKAGGEVAELCARVRQGGALVVQVAESVVASAAPPPSAEAVRHDEERLRARWPAIFEDGTEGTAAPARVAHFSSEGPQAGRVEEPLVSIIIPAYNNWQLTFRCLMSLLEHTSGVRYETIVVDNASTDETAVALPRLEGLRARRNAENLGFATACNQGASMARGRYLLFLNNDIEARANWLPPMLRMMEMEVTQGTPPRARESVPKMGIVGSRLLYPDGTLQHGGVAVSYAGPLPINPVHLAYRERPEASAKPLLLNVVTAACMLIRRDLFDEVGGFDESYRNGFEDVDLCFKARERGWLVGYTPESTLIHHESKSKGRFAATRWNENLLQRRWLGRFKSFDHDRRRRPPPAPRPSEGRPPLTVVLASQDALYGIAPCLEDVAANTAPGDQVVVADAGSRDCTLQFVEGFSLDHPGLVRIVETDFSRSLPAAARAGVAAARNETVILLPRTVSMPPGFLDAFLGEIERSPQGLAALPLGESTVVLGGARARILALLDTSPGAIFGDGDAQALTRMAAANGSPVRGVHAPARPRLGP
jgi:GT2 family glycosyltransferase